MTASWSAEPGVAAEVAALLDAAAAWAESAPGVRAVALVGSRAAGRARADSDVDLVVLADDPARLLDDPAWLEGFGPLASVTAEDWGPVTSLRARYGAGLEVEWGITSPQWARGRPADPGTARVARDGLRPLYDPEGLLAGLIDALG